MRSQTSQRFYASVNEYQLFDKIIQHVVRTLIDKVLWFCRIDMIQEENGDIALQPLIEINSRYTMGHVALH